MTSGRICRETAGIKTASYSCLSEEVRRRVIGTFALVFAGTGAIIINETIGSAITQITDVSRRV